MTKQERHDALMRELEGLRMEVASLRAEIGLLRLSRPYVPYTPPYRPYWYEPSRIWCQGGVSIPATSTGVTINSGASA